MSRKKLLKYHAKTFHPIHHRPDHNWKWMWIVSCNKLLEWPLHPQVMNYINQGHYIIIRYHHRHCMMSSHNHTFVIWWWWWRVDDDYDDSKLESVQQLLPHKTVIVFGWGQKFLRLCAKKTNYGIMQNRGAGEDTEQITSLSCYHHTGIEQHGVTL